MNYKLLPKERPPRYVELPPPMTKCHAGRDVRNKALKIILALLFVAALFPLNSYAEWLYGEGKMGEGLAIKHTPTLDEPWTTLQVCIRTSKGYYWKSAPAIKYTRDYTLYEPEELVWPDEEALLAERKYNTWWKNTYHH